MPSVGLVVLAKDEESCIERCLTSAKPHVAQMVVLDMESSDRTAELARSLGAEVVPVPTVVPWDSTRAEGLKRITTDYVLFLDADEWVEGTLSSPEVRAAMDAGKAIAFPKKNHMGSRWVRGNRWWPNRQVRMMPTASCSITNEWHNYLHTSAPVVSLPARPELAISHAGVPTAKELVESTARYYREENAPLRPRLMLSALARTMYGYLFQGGWRDGTDGVAIAAANWLNYATKFAAEPPGRQGDS